MKIINCDSDNLIEIKKSKFYSFAYYVENVEEITHKLSEIKKNFRDSRHICFAYKLFSPNIEKASDDGEPARTAGVPILEIIKKKELTNILVVVVRYFGGIKLGVGGLNRAYSKSALNVITKSQIVEFKDLIVKQYSLDVKSFNKFKNIYKDEIYDIDFNEKVTFKIKLEKELIEKYDLLIFEMENENN